MALTCLAFTDSVTGPPLPPYKTAGTCPVWRNRRASFFPRLLRGAPPTTTPPARSAMALFPPFELLNSSQSLNNQLADRRLFGIGANPARQQFPHAQTFDLPHLLALPR